MWKILRDKRAVSPVFSTVALILVVVLGMSMLFAYFTDYVTHFQRGQGSAIMELIEIEDVWFKNRQLINLTIYNYGKVDIKITSLYIDGEPVVFFDNEKNVNLIEIQVGKHGSIRVQPSNPLTNSTNYHFKLVTERGSIFEGEYTSPSKQDW